MVVCMCRKRFFLTQGSQSPLGFGGARFALTVFSPFGAPCVTLPSALCDPRVRYLATLQGFAGSDARRPLAQRPIGLVRGPFPQAAEQEADRISDERHREMKDSHMPRRPQAPRSKYLSTDF
jgi:hypothetical protein